MAPATSRPLKGKEVRPSACTSRFDVRVAVALSIMVSARSTRVTPRRPPPASGSSARTRRSRSPAGRPRWHRPDASSSPRGPVVRPTAQPPREPGVISAVFFKERAPVRIVPLAQDNAADGSSRRRPVPAGAAGKAEAQAARAAEEYAATGIGERADHPVRDRAPGPRIQAGGDHRHPATSTAAQLVRLGILPDGPTAVDPLSGARAPTVSTRASVRTSGDS